MTDEYITIKIDVGLLMKKIEDWKVKKHYEPTFSDDIMLSASLNKDRTNDEQPLYKGKNIAVWHNKKD